MRSFLIVVLFGFITFGQTRDIYDHIARLLQEYRRDEFNYVEPSYVGVNDNQGIIAYDFPSRDPTVTFAKELESEGARGYVYMGAVSNATMFGQPIYVKTNEQSPQYVYHILPAPTSAADLLVQLNSEGAQGYRLKRRIFTMEGSFNGYVKSTERIYAEYTYRYLPPPNELDIFFTQANEQGADGYRYWGSYNFPGYSSIYIKDVSQGLSSYVYKPTTPMSSSEEFITKTNELGLDGYRFVAFQLIMSQIKKSSNGIPLWWVVPLYYKDTSKDTFYMYKIMSSPSTFPDYFNQFNEQGEQGYLFIGTQKFSPNDNVIIYFDWGSCQSNQLDIDGGF